MTSDAGAAAAHETSSAPDALELIPLRPPIAGFSNFIGAWLHCGQPRFLVDPGPSATLPELLRAMAQRGVQALDFILLTHIHLDHAGGVGELAAEIADAPIVVHPGGIAHLMEPTRLWEGTIKTLGATGRAYGPMRAVAAERLVSAENFCARGISAHLTPGHAAHHVSYLFQDLLFAGEAGGVSLALEDGEDYLRPATPPRFYLDTALESLETLIALRPRRVAYGHYGLRTRGWERLQRHREQLRLWERLLRQMQPGPGQAPLAAEACLEAVLRGDPLLRAFVRLPAEIQARERGFLLNSVRGFLGWLEAGAQHPGS
jgi:glyoxylase-like metal-dependent hydrolase (beta-lactamase superfamily II)